MVSARTAWETFFNRFASWNTLHGGSYREKARYPPASAADAERHLTEQGNLTGGPAPPGERDVKVVPATNLPTTKQLVVEVDAPDTSSGSTALLQVRFRTGSTRRWPSPSTPPGNGARTTGFDRTRISSAVVVLATPAPP